MFEYVWCDEKVVLPISPETDIPSDFYSMNDIEYQRFLYFGEHCLECAVPLCYGNCEKWIEREDKKCRKFYYGIYRNNNFSLFPNAAQLKFYDWGKLFSQNYHYSISPKKEKIKDISNKRKAKFILSISRLLKAFSPTCKLNGAFEHFVKTSNKKRRDGKDVTHFLFQGYSNDKKTYNLIIEISDNSSIILRDNIKVSFGYFQKAIPISSIDIDSATGISIYPENNYNTELVVLNSTFVKFKKNPDIKISKAAEFVKCVAWDLDNTLWDGILIESNPEDLKLRKGVLETIKALDNRGIIQVIVSKNNKDDVVPVLNRLNIRDYFVAEAVNWNPKSENIRKLAEIINININSFALIDDSEYERSEVSENCGCVRVYPEICLENSLLSKPEFNVPVTKDGLKRREMYRQEFERKKKELEFKGNNTDFLRSCELTAQIGNIKSEEEKKRAYELLQRTNQLNLSGKRYTFEEFENLLSKNPKTVLIVHAWDKYGNYGQVGFIYYAKNYDNITIYEFAFSCRVAKKCIESVCINHLFDIGANKITLSGVNNQKNGLLIKTLEEIGFVREETDKKQLKLTIADRNLLKYTDVVRLEVLPV